jgi:hypothetical protein
MLPTLKKETNMHLSWRLPRPWVGAPLLALFCLPAAADQPPSKGDRPKPLSADVAEAWQKAGAEIGWMNMDEHAGFHSRGKDEGQSGEVPAFRFTVWPAGADNLPQPPRAFGLNHADTQMTDAELKVLAGWESLQALNLSATGITDAGLNDLTPLTNLQVLILAETRITDAGLKELYALPNLHTLYLGGTGVTDAGLKELARLEGLRSIYLNSTHVTDAGLQTLVNMESLHSLCLSGNAVTDAGAKEVAGLANLQVLYIFGTHVTERGINELRKALPSCNIKR